MIKRIVILGHTGFIGSHVEKSLIQNLHHNYPAIEIMGRSLPPIDLAENASLLKNYFGLETAVIMCAAVKKQLGDTLEIYRKNMAIVINLCTVLEESPVHRLIYLSSAEVYGHFNHDPLQQITEETPVHPTSYYGIAKYAAERMLQKVMPQKVIILRPPQIYGPDDMPCYGPSGFLQAAHDKTPITLWGSGEEKREFIFVKDVIALIQQLLFSEYNGILNISSGVSYSYKDVLNIITLQTNLSLSVNSKPRTLPAADFYFNNQKLRNIFPAFIFTPLSEGIKTMDIELRRKRSEALVSSEVIA